MAAPTIVVDWGRRSRSLQASLSSKVAGASFLLASPGLEPVYLGWINPLDTSAWDQAMTVPVPLVRGPDPLQVTATLTRPVLFNPPDMTTPVDFSQLRLDFDLYVTAGGIKKRVLAFRQLFVVSADGALMPTHCAFDFVTVQASPSGPVISTGPGPIARRRCPGLHPLLSVTAGVISVNAEFVDLTELWWAIRKDKLGWYLHPDLGGRQRHLRVLGWTGGGSPMIWFAVISDDASFSLDQKPEATERGEKNADVVYFRPPAQPINSFLYTPDERGLLDTRHDDTTLRILGRYLLSPIPEKDVPRLKGHIKDVEFLAERLQLTGGTPATPLPADPMDIAFGFPFAFRPVGLESAFNRAAGTKVLFLPLAAGDAAAAYEGAVRKDLGTTVRSALMTLWTSSALARARPPVPDFKARELWLAGHSGGNLSMWACAQNNAADVARMITFDASPWDKNLAGGVQIIAAVAKARKGLRRQLDVFAIVTPNLGQNRAQPPGAAARPPFQGLDDATDAALRATGAAITVLPEFSRRESFWNPLPPATPKTFVQNLLANWPDAGLAESAKRPHRWRFLFFHEMAVFGGDLVAPPAGSPPGTPPTLQTFFEQALGKPNPRPP